MMATQFKTLAQRRFMLLPPLLREWVKATSVSCSRKNALVTIAAMSIFIRSVFFVRPNSFALQFIPPRFVIYQALYERLKAIDCIADAARCFHQMTGELAEEMNSHCELREWAVGG